MHTFLFMTVLVLMTISLFIAHDNLFVYSTSVLGNTSDSHVFDVLCR